MLWLIGSLIALVAIAGVVMWAGYRDFARGAVASSHAGQLVPKEQRRDVPSAIAVYREPSSRRVHRERAVEVVSREGVVVVDLVEAQRDD